MPPDRRNAFVATFRVFASTWPKVFAAGRVAELAPVWTAALAHVGTDVLEAAAVRYCAEVADKFPPKPAAFAKFARQLQTQHTGVSEAAPVAELPELPKQGDRIAAMSQWAYERLGTWALVAEVWAVLMDTAPTPELRHAVREGTVDREIFRDAVTAVQHGKRVMRRGPLAGMVGAA